MFSLAPYRISVSQKGQELPLSRTEDNSGLVEWLYEYLEKKLGALEPRQNRRVVRVAKVCANANYTFICGKFQTGEHGFTSELVDSASNEVSHERAITEAEMIPFFFSLAVPKQGHWGVLILQRFKNLGIRDFFIPLMASQFNAEHGDARMHVDRLVPTTFINTLLEGSQVKTLRLVKYELPKAIEDAFGGDGFASKVSDVEIVVHAKRSSALPILDSIKAVVGGKKNTADIASISGWDFDTVKLDVEYAGRRRTIDIGKPDKVSANLDITEGVATAADGHPEWDDILATAIEFSEGLLSAQGVTVMLDKVLTIDKEAPKLAATKKV